MKKKIILLFIILLLAGICFIPVSQNKTIPVKSQFLNLFTQLQTAVNWEKWRSDLRPALATDSDKIATKSFPNAFKLNYKNLSLDVKLVSGSFIIAEQNAGRNIDYSFTVLPGKSVFDSFITVQSTEPLFKYLASGLKDDVIERTHVTDLKSFMETDSLYYGCNIFKTRVPASRLVVMKKEVLNAEKFAEAAEIVSSLHQYIKSKNLTQTIPVIAQFIPKGKDSTEVNVALGVNKDITPPNGIIFNRMPEHGPLLSARYYGPFNKRQKVYIAINKYFAEKKYQQAILPFEIYLDNKLPVSDTGKVKIQVNFSSYF